MTRRIIVCFAAAVGVAAAGLAESWAMSRDGAHIQVGELVQAMLGQVGIQAKIRVVEWG